LLAAREPTRDEPGRALRPVPAAEVLDHRLRVHGCLRVGGELAHRRRAVQPLRAGAELGEDLIVGVPLTDTRLERGQGLRVDAGEGPVRLPGHVNKDRSVWKTRKSGRSAPQACWRKGA